MKNDKFPRMHVSLNVSSIEKTIAFYNVVFKQPPSKVKEDYAKYELDKPSLIISFIENPSNIQPAFGHLGFQVEHLEELETRLSEIRSNGIGTLEERETSCCYAKQDKFWLADPDGHRWEIYYFHNDVEFSEPNQKNNSNLTSKKSSSELVSGGSGCC